MARLLDWLRPKDAPQPPPPDPLDDVLRKADRLKTDAYYTVNQSRRRRGEEPLSWEELIEPGGPRANGEAP